MSRNQFYRNKKGQTLVEVFFLVPVLVIIISALFFFARVVITRQQLVMASRYGTDMILNTQLSVTQIKQEIRNYLSDPGLRGRRLDPAKLSDENIVIMDRSQNFQIPDLSNAGWILMCPGGHGIFKTVISGFCSTVISELSNPINDTSYVEIYYRFDMPGIFNAMGRYYPGGPGMPSGITVSGRSEVLAGTGCKSPGHRRNR